MDKDTKVHKGSYSQTGCMFQLAYCQMSDKQTLWHNRPDHRRRHHTPHRSGRPGRGPHRSSSGRRTVHADIHTRWWVASHPHIPIRRITNSHHKVCIYVFVSLVQYYYDVMNITVPQADLDPGSLRSSVSGHSGQSRSGHCIPETWEPLQHQPPVVQLHQYQGLDGGTPPGPSCTQSVNMIRFQCTAPLVTP